MTPYDPGISLIGSGPGLVLVPGMDGTGALFYRQIPTLARSYRVATYALRDTAVTMDDLVDDLARVVDATSSAGDPAIVVGESFGGALAMSFALARPDRVAALVVINSFPKFGPTPLLKLGILGLSVMPWGAMRLVRRLTAFRLHSRHTHGDDIRQFLRRTGRATREGYIGRLKLLTRYDLRERLKDLQPPTLFLAASHDHLVPAIAQATLMTARVPGAAMHVLEGHGHICLIAPDLDLEHLLQRWRNGRLPVRTRPPGPESPAAPAAAPTRL